MLFFLLPLKDISLFCIEFSDTSLNRAPPPKPIVLRSRVDVLCALFSTCVESLFHPCEKIRCFFWLFP